GHVDPMREFDNVTAGENQQDATLLLAFRIGDAFGRIYPPPGHLYGLHSRWRSPGIERLMQSARFCKKVCGSRHWRFYIGRVRSGATAARKEAGEVRLGGKRGRHETRHRTKRRSLRKID